MRLLGRQSLSYDCGRTRDDCMIISELYVKSEPRLGAQAIQDAPSLD